MSQLEIFRHYHRIFIYCFYLISSQLSIQLVNGFICDQQCTCIQSSGKFTANCTGLSLHRLPQVINLNNINKNNLLIYFVLFLFF